MKPENKVLQDAGVEITYSTSQVAKIFDKTRQWVLWSVKNNRFLDKDGTPIQLTRTADDRYVWTAQNIKDAAITCYYRRTMDMDELKRIIRKVIKDTGDINELY